LRGAAFDAAFGEAAKSSPGAAWTVDHGQWALGFDRPSGFLDIWNDYTLFGLAERMDRPLLSIFGESELARFGDGHGTAEWAGRMLGFLADAPGYGETYVFTDEEGGSPHCQMGGIGQGAAVTMSWLENVLGDHSARAAQNIRDGSKVLHPDFARVMRGRFGGPADDGLRKLNAKPSGSPLAI
jgi:hypothetical protein